MHTSLYIKFSNIRTHSCLSWPQVNPVNCLSDLLQKDLWSFNSVTLHWKKCSTQNFQDIKYIDLNL